MISIKRKKEISKQIAFLLEEPVFNVQDAFRYYLRRIVVHYSIFYALQYLFVLTQTLECLSL